MLLIGGQGGQPQLPRGGQGGGQLRNHKGEPQEWLSSQSSQKLIQIEDEETKSQFYLHPQKEESKFQLLNRLAKKQNAALEELNAK